MIEVYWTTRFRLESQPYTSATGAPIWFQRLVWHQNSDIFSQVRRDYSAGPYSASSFPGEACRASELRSHIREHDRAGKAKPDIRDCLQSSGGPSSPIEHADSLRRTKKELVRGSAAKKLRFHAPEP